METLLDGALKSPTEAEHFVQQMEIEIDNLTQIVQELLDLSKIESGKVPLELKPVAPHELLDPGDQELEQKEDANPPDDCRGSNRCSSPLLTVIV